MSGDGTHIHNCALDGANVWGHELREMEGGEEVEFKQRARFGQRSLGRAEVRASSCIIDKAIDSAKASEGGLHDADAEGLIGKISGDDQILRSCGLAESGFIPGHENQRCAAGLQGGSQSRTDAL